MNAAVGEIAGGFGEAAGDAFKITAGGNGREFAGPGDAVDCAVYFRHPHSKFEKGANERHSRLLCRFAEKGRSVDGMPAPLYAKAADWNNNLPRKIPAYRTPAEMFEREILKIAQGAAPSPPPIPTCFRLGRGKTSLCHLLHLILKFITSDPGRTHQWN
ncbi:MAG: hypothetical protein LBU32_24380 [Clostridiales bacterium]|nr:hypothetical protein [Clostridiales bacterium]